MKTNRGFTLIELLVVIAIIGILSSVVLASLNTARGKGEDAAVKANLANARAQAELYYDNNSNAYTNVCTAAGGISANVTAASAVCESDDDTWVAIAPLNTDYFCVDSTGTAEVVVSATTPAPDPGDVCGDL